MSDSAVQNEIKRLRTVARDFEYVLMMIDKEIQIHQTVYDKAIDSKTQEKFFYALEPLKNLKAKIDSFIN